MHAVECWTPTEARNLRAGDIAQLEPSPDALDAIGVGEPGEVDWAALCLGVVSVSGTPVRRGSRVLISVAGQTETITAVAGATVLVRNASAPELGEADGEQPDEPEPS